MKFLLFFAMFPFAALAQLPELDILITNGRIIDGTGNNWYYGNVGIRDGRIVKVGRDVQMKAKKIIDAGGKIVAPGFIDVHTHLEGDEARDPNATNFILDGVTTCV